MNQTAMIETGSDKLGTQKEDWGLGAVIVPPHSAQSTWKSAYQLYLEKTGEAEPQPENWRMATGKAMEPQLRQHFADHFGVEVRLPAVAMVSDEYPWLRYNPDGLAGNILAEFKTARSAQGWGEPGSDEIPAGYAIQCQHGLIVTKKEVARPSVSIAFAEPVYYEIMPDKELQQMIIEGTHDFWQRVQDKNPPEPTTAEDVARRFKISREGRVIAAPEISTAVLKLIAIRDGIKILESEKEIAEVYIKNFMGENETLVDENGVPLITWKQQAGSKRIDNDALRKNYPDVAASVTRIGEPVRRFLVK